MIISLPYGAGNQILDTQDWPAEVLSSGIERLKPKAPGAGLVRQAMDNPAGGVRLEALAQNAGSATIIISDHTRPVPSRDILPPMLARLRAARPDIAVTLLVATGCHRGTSPEELRAKLGDELYEREKIVVHNCDDTACLADIGPLPSGARLVVNRHAVETDLLLAEGFIEPHFFAGYSGGRKSVLPGICGRATVLGNHCARFIASPHARTGVLRGNPIHADMLAAVKLARLAYIVNVIIDDEKRTVFAFAGDPIAAHEAGCQTLAAHCGVTPARPADIVVTTNGGAPLDQNLYQAVKGMTAAEAAAAKDAILIICAECADGCGGEHFHAAVKSCESPAALLRQVLRVPQNQTEPDQWQYQILARVLERHRVMMVTHPAARRYVADMKMEWYENVQAAWNTACAQKPGGHATVIKNGVSVVANAPAHG